MSPLSRKILITILQGLMRKPLQKRKVKPTMFMVFLHKQLRTSCCICKVQYLHGAYKEECGKRNVVLCKLFSEMDLKVGIDEPF